MLQTCRDQHLKLLGLIVASDASRLEEGRMPVAAQVVQLPMLISEIMGEVRELLEKPGLSVKVEIEDGLPPLHTDPAKLKIVIKNLLNNAVKFTETGHVTISVRRMNDGAELSVADTGVGIAPEILPHIFDMFRQGDSSATRRYEGVGLGLYIVQRLVALLKGTVSVESNVGQGATFHVWLPHGRQLPEIEFRS
jgi:signal transduction histidine kinase